MYLCLRKTSVALWCTILLLWGPWSSSEASTKLNGLTSTFSSATVEGVQPPDSTSRDGHKGSSSFAVSQVFGSPLRRQLLQRSVPSDTDDGGTCGLTPSQRRRFYSTSSRTWNISDSVVEELTNDIQSVVSCAAQGDTILLPTARRIQPRRTIIISNNITMTAQSEGPLFRNGSIAETANKVRLTCPSSGDLLVIKSGSALIANMIFEECKGTGHVMSIETRCDDNSAQDTVHLRHLEFRDLTLSKDQRLLESVQPSCTHLVMENVIIWNNTCGASGCMSLSMNNTLRDIQATGNQAMRSNVAVESLTVLVLLAGSTSVATNVSALRNGARVFSVANATLTLRSSDFDGNIVNQDVGASLGGSVLVSNDSNIRIKDSFFRNNSGLNGGAVYAQYSTMDIRNTSFQENRVNEAGSAIHFLYESLSLEDVNITDNLADPYGTVLIGHSSATLTRVRFLCNSARSYGGGLSFHNSNITVRNSTFENNSCGYSGAAIYASSSSNLSVLDTVLQNNSAESNGGGIYAWNCNVSLTKTNFTRNRGDNGGGCYFNDVNVTFERVHLDLNRATDGSGGGMYTEKGKLRAMSLTFQENQAIERGGGIYASDLAAMNISESNFTSNNAVRSGGGTFMEHLVTMFLSDVRFQNNTGRFGAGCYFYNVSATMRNLTFSKNKATDGSGAGIYAENGTLNGELLTFTENEVSKRGGALRALHLDALLLFEVYFYNNIADFGGGIFAERVLNLSLMTTRFENNSDGISGGGICGEYLQSMSFSDVHFRNNTSRLGGGGYFNNVNATVYNITFSRNRATDGSGGGMHIENGTLNGDLLTFRENRATEWGGSLCISGLALSHLSEVFFYNNMAEFGGGVFVERAVNLSLSTTRFENNSASRSGGGIYGEDLESISLWDSYFQNNTARSGGGGYFKNTNATINKGTFSRNRAIDGSGGGIYVNIGRLYGNSIMFQENQARELGGAIHGANSLSLAFSKVQFHRNSGNDGGAIAIYNTILKLIRSCIFTKNRAIDNGGSIYQHLSVSSISSCRFEKNSAKFGGSLWIGDLNMSTISNCTFHESRASSLGGAVHIYDRAMVTVATSSFSECTSDNSGGAISVFNLSILTVSESSFLGNLADAGAGIVVFHGTLDVQESVFKQGRATTSGGSIDATNGIVTIETSTIQNNNVSYGIGGALNLHSSNATISSTELSTNQAPRGGAIFATNDAHVNATNLSFHSNVAIESGGGMEMESGSSLLCRGCLFNKNEAKRGGGMNVRANESMPIIAQLQGSIFTNNTAFSYGGGLLFTQQPEAIVSCNASKTTCSQVVLLSTTFQDNHVEVSGSAIFTSDPKRVLVSCNHTKPEYDFMDQDRLSLLDLIHPKNICRSWTGNRIATANPTELNVSTFGQNLSFGIEQNVTNGGYLPVIHVKVLDAYGNGPSYTVPRKLEATMESPNGFFNGTLSLTIRDGSGTISEIANLKPPQNYTIRITTVDEALPMTKIKVHVRDCRIGEELTSSRFCQPCDAFSYNFNVSKVRGCTLCPNGATCETRSIVTRDGYWHKSPCDANVQECLIRDACTYKGRQQALKNYSRSFVYCSFDETILKNYNEVLCRDGYKGALCGSCSESYGLSVQFKCLECPHTFGSVLTLIGFTLYLLFIASITIRGGLPLKLKKSRANTPSESLPSQTPSRASSDEQVVNLEMVAMISQDQVASHDIQEDAATSSSNTQPQVQSNEPELTRWITTEIFKVMINFLQVTGVAASINVEWTEGVLTMFEVTEYVGALSSDDLSRPIDCLISSDSASVRSIWRTSLNIFVPIVVMGIFVAMWGIITHREKKGVVRNLPSSFLNGSVLSI